ncbi:MAG: hypothetical protein ABSC50_03275 [Candidatus Bathyarchaeia archaeon]
MPDLEPIRLSAEDVRRALLDEAKKYPQHRPWKAWEDEVLREFHGKVPYHILAQKLGRTMSMVSHRLEILGLTKRKTPESLGNVVKNKVRERN